MAKLDSVLAILVQNLKATVTLTTNVKKVSDVVQTIVQHHLVLMHTQIAVMIQLLELWISAQQMNLVKWMKAIVIPMMNARVICFVDQTTVPFCLAFYLLSIVVNQKVINKYTCYFLAIICII